jgi:GNAT superfamily N-acetyltransferase
MSERDDRFWATFLGIQPEQWNLPGLSVRPHAALQGYCGVWFFKRKERLVVSAPAGWVDILERRLAGAPLTLPDAPQLVALFGPAFARSVGPAYQGCVDPQRFQPHSGRARGVGAGDALAVEGFRRACGEEEWESGGIDEAPDYRAAVFEGGEIVALVGFRHWTADAGDPCVLTHPGYRGRGLATEATRAVVATALAAGKLLLYQTLEANTAAVRVATKVGYERYGQHLAVRLHGLEP